MRTLTRLSLIAGVAVLAQGAFAAINYNVLQADVTYQNGDVDTLNSQINGNSITFTGSSAIGVGDGFFTGEGHTAATVTIIYTVTSDDCINGLDLIFTGQAFNLADVSYSELVKQWDPINGEGPGTLASVSGDYAGAGLGGSNSAFTNETFLGFNECSNSYLVKKTFTLTDLDLNPNLSFATIGFVEQAAVPEPASMGALAIGAFGLLARRRRRSK